LAGFDVGLDDEHILAADVFVNFDKDFAVIEPFDTCVDQPYVDPPMQRHPPCDGFGQRHVRVT